MGIMRTVIVLSGAVTVVSACARDLPKDSVAYVKAVQSSPSYHDGYVDGCQTADYSHDRQKMRRDEDRFQNDPNYRLGWTAGSENCHDTVFTPSTGRPTNSAIPNVY